MRTLRGHENVVRCLGYSPDGRWLASGSEDRMVRLWDLATGTVATEPLRHRGSVETLSFAPDGAGLVTGTSRGEVTCWSVPRGEPTASLAKHREAIRCLAHSHDGRILAMASWDRFLTLGDVATLWERNIVVSDSLYTALAFAPHESILLGATDEGLLLRHNARGERSRILLDAGPAIHALAHSPDGRLLAAGRAGGEVVLLPTRTERPQAILRGHSWIVYALAFTPDGRTLISGSADGTVRLWDVATQRERRCFRWHDSWVTCLAISPDGMTAAAGGADRRVVVWDLDDD